MFLEKGISMIKSKYFILVSSLSMLVAGGGLTGCAMWQGREARETGRTVDQYTNDKRISDRVEDALKTAQVYKYPGIHVATYQGTVQLSGFVHTDDQKRQAEQIARNVPGVNRVIDNLALIPETPTPTGQSQGYPANPAQNNPGAPR